MFVHLHGHSHFSLLEGIGKPRDILMKAQELKMPAIALTDYNGLYGALEFYKTAQAEDIKPIIGVELSLVQDITVKPKDELPYFIVLLAKNEKGYQNLLKLVSHANLE